MTPQSGVCDQCKRNKVLFVVNDRKICIYCLTKEIEELEDGSDKEEPKQTN